MTDGAPRLRVAIATREWPDAPDGGVALSEVLARGLRRVGCEVEVWTPGGRKSKDTAPSDTQVLTITGSWWRRSGRSQWKKATAARLAEFKPQLVVGTTWRPLPGVLDAVADAPADARPRVAVFGGVEMGEQLTGASKSERKEVLGAGVRWLTFTDRYARFLSRAGVPGDRVFRLQAAVAGPETPPDRGIRARPRRILTVAPLVPPAGQDKVIEALSRLGGASRLKYEVVGTGPDEARLRALAESHGLADQVVFRGRLDGPGLEHAYARGDIFALPARRGKGNETEPDFATLWLEASARGLPILGSGVVGGLEDGVNAKIVERPSDAAAVTEALEELIKFPLALTSLGRNARLRFEACGRPAHLGEAVVGLVESWQD